MGEEEEEDWIWDMGYGVKRKGVSEAGGVEEGMRDETAEEGLRDET